MTASGPVPSARLYWTIWGWLAGLMLLGVVLSEWGLLPISTTRIVQIVVALSTIKALLVALYYMHLKADRRLLVLVAVFPFVLILLALGVLYSSRFIRL
jgi:caa(3)-type oxidase subunit IV